MAMLRVGLALECLPVSDGASAGLPLPDPEWVEEEFATRHQLTAPKVTASQVEQGGSTRYHVEVVAEASARDSTSAIREAQNLDRTLAGARKVIEYGRLEPRHSYCDLEVQLRSQWVMCPIPRPERLVPGIPHAPEHVICSAIEAMMDFCEDRRAAWRGLKASVESGGESLRLETTDPQGEIVEAAKAFLEAADHQQRAVAGPPPGVLTSLRIGAVAVTSIALMTIGLSFASASSLAVGILAALTVGIAGVAMRQAWHGPWSSPTRVLAGMSPMLVIVGFAVVYGLVMDNSQTAITHSGHHVTSLGDALLLSLNVALTGGIPDLTLTGTVRVVVYIEMVLFIGTVGASVTLAGRWALRELKSLLASNSWPERRAAEPNSGVSDPELPR
jgi:hypothetical protein